MSFPPCMIGHMQAMGIIEAPPDLADQQSMDALEDNLSRGSDTAPESNVPYMFGEEAVVNGDMATTSNDGDHE